MKPFSADDFPEGQGWQRGAALTHHPIMAHESMLMSSSSSSSNSGVVDLVSVRRGLGGMGGEGTTAGRGEIAFFSQMSCWCLHVGVFLFLFTPFLFRVRFSRTSPCLLPPVVLKDQGESIIERGGG